MNHMWVIGAFFKKWVIVYYSRMESKFQNLKPYNIYFNYADFKFLDQNLRSWPSFEKLSPTFFATSNFETRLSRDPITWHPEVRCFGYKMTHFIILPPQKFFSRTLQILGFIAESGHCSYTILYFCSRDRHVPIFSIFYTSNSMFLKAVPKALLNKSQIFNDINEIIVPRSSKWRRWFNDF